MSRLKSDYTGWQIRAGLKDGKLFDFVNGSLVAIAGRILSIVIGVAWIIFVTHRNYRPIELIILRINTYLHQKRSPAGKDEFKYIESALHDGRVIAPAAATNDSLEPLRAFSALANYFNAIDRKSPSIALYCTNKL